MIIECRASIDSPAGPLTVTLCVCLEDAPEIWIAATGTSSGSMTHSCAVWRLGHWKQLIGPKSFYPPEVIETVLCTGRWHQEPPSEVRERVFDLLQSTVWADAEPAELC